MYNSSMHRIYRSPDAGEGGGLPAAAAPQAAPVESAAPAPEYLSKADFESKWNELGSRLDRLTPREQAQQNAREAKPSAPQKPRLSDYKINSENPKAEEELERYNSDVYRWNRHQERETDAKEAATKAAQERQEKSIKGHKARTIDYKKTNPTYDADMKAHGPMEVENDVAESVYESEESAAIVHFFAKNKGVADELNQLANMGSTRAIDRRIGEIEAQIRAERKSLEANAEAAATKIPRQNFSKGSKGASHEMTLEERYERNRS